MAFPHGLRALNHGDYRRFYFSQFAAQIGSWMQNVAQAWLVLQLTGSPFKLGLLATLQFSPVLLFSIEKSRTGENWSVARRPSLNGEPVSWRTSHACATFCIQLPICAAN